MRRISRLNPPQRVGRESAERHYTNVHYPFARGLLRDHGPKVVRYATNRAERQYSITGRFDEPRRHHYLDVHLPSMTKLLGHAFGARLYVSNVVARQAETSDEHGPSASYTGGYLKRPDLVAVDEFWFDNAGCGGDFFSSDEAVGLLRDSRWEGRRATSSPRRSGLTGPGLRPDSRSVS